MSRLSAIVALLGLAGVPGAVASSPEGEDAVPPGQNEPPGSPVPDLPLPEWDPEEYRQILGGARRTNLGGGLWPAEQITIFPDPVAAAPPPELEPAGGAGAEGQGKLLSYALFNRYFAERPSSFLSDPQGLVPRPFYDNVERFLRYHSSESEIETYVLVFQGAQEFPIELSTRAIWRRWFPEGKGAIVFYYAGEPESTAIEFGQVFAEQAGNDRLEGLLSACIEDAAESSFPGGQLERFCVRYSVRTYQLEKSIARETRELVAAEAPAVASGGVREKPLWPWGIAASGLAAAGLFWWGRTRRPLYLPEVEELPVRLGGEHTGGTDAVMSFGRA